MKNDLIVVRQLPVIEEQLRAFKEDVDRVVEGALSRVCNEETVASVKDTRAQLNKQFQELESRRKDVKKAIMEPYDAFERIYKECVSDAFRQADVELKGKINAVEADIKGRCEERMREYFDELCAAERIDFLRFEQVGLKIGLTEAKSKSGGRLREQIAAFVTGVSESVHLISDMEDADEIMVEFKRTLNAASAIATVQDRHRRVEEEQAAKAARQEAQRREDEAVAKVVAVAPPVAVSQPVQAAPEKLYRCTFTVSAPLSKLKKLKEFLNQEGIRYE